MKYLIVKCEELHDQYECDCDRVPVCITDDYSQYGEEYEVYEVQKDGSLALIRNRFGKDNRPVFTQ